MAPEPNLPSLTAAQLREVDRLAIEELGIPGVVLMENAALGVVRHAQAMGAQPGRTVAILCGSGNNGGDGYAVARHLSNLGVQVSLYAASAIAQLRGDAGIQARICHAMGMPMVPLERFVVAEDLAAELGACDLVIDALLGTGFQGRLRPVAIPWIKALVQTARLHAIPVLAIDVPSGLDADTGEALDGAVQATRTVTFVAPKCGFENPNAAPHLGNVWVEGIGAPPTLIQRALSPEPS